MLTKTCLQKYSLIAVLVIDIRRKSHIHMSAHELEFMGHVTYRNVTLSNYIYIYMYINFKLSFVDK